MGYIGGDSIFCELFYRVLERALYMVLYKVRSFEGYMCRVF